MNAKPVEVDADVGQGEGDVSGIPNNAEILEANLRMNVIKGNSSTLKAYMLSESWKEGTCIDQYTCQKPDGVTWFSKNSEVSSDWSEPGGVWNNGILMNGDVVDNEVQVDITEAVKSWLNGNEENNGLVLRDVNQWTYLYLSSKESSQAPIVTIRYLEASEQVEDNSMDFLIQL
ncbi:hypothetical protein MHK_007201 [Candidatus Magnetomorum sp. HK-1]|nr:hypothetical protein MHK_007201 [Candidatus Magnetomorum sp. HK-1]